MICSLYSASIATVRQAFAHPTEVDAVLSSVRDEDQICIEKSWHGLHFVLTGTGWEGEPPLNFILGGEPIGEDYRGYGPVWVIFPPQVALLDSALTAITPIEFDRRFNPERMAEADIYPSIWDEPREDLLAEYDSYFKAVRGFVRRTAQAGNAILVTLS